MDTNGEGGIIMIIAAESPFKNGDFIKEKYSHLLQEIEEVIGAVDATLYKTKISKEKRTKGTRPLDNNEIRRVSTFFAYLHDIYVDLLDIYGRK